MTSADVVAQFCLQLARLRRLALEEGRVADLDALVAAAISGEDVAARLVELSRQIGGPELRTRGVDAGVPMGGPFGPGQPVGGRYVCPHGRCNRAERRAPGGPVPECRLAPVPLVFEA
ncbi:hypothetical protein AB0I98_38450 [Streptomyces sp. NPDC050211]|uniref:hypothetical protein n=1 Tax=Streptomyces sp. NPDC050211 TaxID=3154932 RepID=UPI003436A2AC